MNEKSKTPLIIAGVIVAWLILSRPSNVASYSSGVLGTRVNIPGVGSYSQTPWGTAIELAAALANPLGRLLSGGGQTPIGAAPANPGTVFSPYDPNIAASPDPSAGLLVDSGAIDPTVIYGGDPSGLGDGTNGITPADLSPVDLSGSVVPS